MATGNSLTSTFEASDELCDFFCSVCAENSTTKEATIYCKDCAEYLCKECLQHHNRFPKMRSHVITDTSGQVYDSQMPMTVSKADLPKCAVHHGNTLTLLCIQHDEFCCQSCVALKHRSCSSTVELTQAAKNIKSSHDYQQKVSAVTEVLTLLQEEKGYTQNCLMRFESEREKVFKNVETYQEKLHAHVDEIAQKTKQKISLTYKISETKVRTNIFTLDTVIASTEQTLQNMTSENDVMSLFHMKSCRNVVHECQELLREMRHHAGKTTPKFRLNTDILNKLVHHESLLAEVTEEVLKEYQKVKEVVTNLKLIETRMLLADKFPTKMESLYPELTIKINQGKNEILFEGMLGDVQEAKLKMYELKNNFAVTTVDPMPWCKSSLYHLKQTKDHIVKKLRGKGVVAVWEMTDNILTVVSVSDEQLKVSVSILSESVVKNSLPFKPASRSVLNSEQWQIKVEELHAANTGKCLITVNDRDSKIHVCGTDDIANEVFDSVKNHLRLHTVGEEKITCTRNIHRLIERHNKDEIVKITKELQNYQVQIISLENYDGFQIRGTEDGIKQAKTRLDFIINSAKQREHTLQKPGLGEHMQTPKGKDSLNTIETQLKCVVTVKTDDDDAEKFQFIGDAATNFRMKDTVFTAFCKAYDTRNIYIVKGDMTELTVDAFINPADDKLSLAGGLGKAFLVKGGRDLGQECAEFIKSEQKLDDGEVFVSTAGNLQAQFIIHVMGPVWKDGRNQEEEMLSEAVFKCLMQASARNLKSVAVPAISCGSFGFPLNRATLTIVQSLKRFFREVRDSTLINIYLGDVKENTVKGFQEALGQEFGQQNVRNMQVARESGEDHQYEELPGGTVKKFVESVKGLWRGNKENNDDTYIRHEGKKKKRIDPNKVTFIILAFSDDTINKAIKKLEVSIEMEIHEKTFADSIFKKMDDNQMIEIKAIAKEFNLEMNFQPDKGCLKICGMSANVISASDKIHRIMRDAATLEQEKNSAALLLSLLQWFFIEITETAQVLEKYEKDLNYKIETAYQSQAPNVKFKKNKVNYILDFTKMVEYPEDDPTDVVSVIRRDLVKQDSFEQPSNWADMTGVSNLRVVILQNTDQEYQDIATKFSASVGGIGVKITMIERIQNKTLWAHYQAKKKQLEVQNPLNTQNEKLLWHGTAPEAVDNINFHGFNRSYCGKNATAYGDGVYFAVKAIYSAHDTYSRPDASGTKKIYYSRVLTGVYTRGASKMRVPPSKSGPGSTDLFDSVVDNQNNPGMYIIFHDTQAYPEYLVSFKRG